MWLNPHSLWEVKLLNSISGEAEKTGLSQAEHLKLTARSPPVQDRSLSVNVSISSGATTSSGDALVAPGASANISVAVARGGKPVEGAEITIVAGTVEYLQV